MGRNEKRSRRDSGSTNFSSFDRGRFPRDMHKATCADCGKGCEVPFKPREGRPVYCKECYVKHRPKRF